MALNVLNTLLNQLNSGSYVYGDAGTAYRGGLLTENEFTVFQNNFNEYTNTQPGERPYSVGDVITGAYGEEPEEEFFLKEKEKQCPEGFYFDKTLGMCVLDEEVTTPVEPSPEPEPEPEPAPEPEPDSTATFTFFRGSELGDASPTALYDRADSAQVTVEELREYFNSEGSAVLRQAFGDFDNYLAYMTEREQLIQSGDYDVGNWSEYTGGLTEDELMLLDPDADLTQYGDDAQDTYEELSGRLLQEQTAAYNNWANSEANQELLAKYGVSSVLYNSDGDTFRWNGSAYVKTDKINDSGLRDGFAMLLVALATGGTNIGESIATALGLSGPTASAVAGAIDSVVRQGLNAAVTGQDFDLDLRNIIASAVSGGLLDSEIGENLLNQLPETGITALDQAIQAGVMSSATQLLFSGEIDLPTLIQAMARAGLSDPFESLLNQIREAASLEGEAFEEFLRNLQEQFPDIDAGAIEDAIRDLADSLPTDEVEDVLSSIADRAGQGWEDFTQYLEDSGYTIEDFDLFESVLSTLGKAIPNRWDDVKTLFESIIDGMNPFSHQCTGTSTRVEQDPLDPRRTYEVVEPQIINRTADRETHAGGWTGKSVVYDTSTPVFTPGGIRNRVVDTYDGWMDCVNLRGLLEIPFLDIPLPPGLTDISIADLRKAVMSAGDSFEDFLGDPGAWLEEKIQDIIGGITEPFENSDALLEYLGTILGGVLAGALYDEIKERLEGEIPDLFLPFAPEEEGNDCQVEVDGELTAGKVTGGQCIPLSPQDQQERCDTDQVFADANPSICGEGLLGNQTENNEKCEKDYGVGYYYDTELEQCVELTAGTDPIKDPDEDKEDLDNELTEDFEAQCRKLGKVYDPDKKECVDGPPVTRGPSPPDFGMCDDGVTPKTDEQGSNCNCQNDVYRGNNPERCVDSIVVEPDPGPVSGPEPEPVICNDEGSTTYGQEGECGPCKEGFSKVGKRCVEDITRPGPKPKPEPGPEPEPVICNDEGSTTFGQEGMCGPCKEGFSKVGKLCVEDVTRPGPKPEPDPDPEPNPCDDKKYAEDNPLQCGGVIEPEPEPEPEPNPCDNEQYARDNPLQCGGVIEPEPEPEPEPNPCLNPGFAAANPILCGELEPEPEPEPEPCPPGQVLGVDGVCIDVPPGGGGGGGGGGGTGGTDLGMLTGGVGWARQPFVAVEYRAPTRAIDVLNQFVESEIKSSLFS